SVACRTAKRGSADRGDELEDDMLDGLVRHVVRTIRARTGANTAMVVCIPVVAVAGLFALAFLSWAAYLWLGELYGPGRATLAVAGVYVVIAAPSPVPAP